MAPEARTEPFEVAERAILELQSAMNSGRTTSVELVDAYLARIAAYDQAGPRLNAVIRLNPQARTDAAALDAERGGGQVRGPLHGVPVILKDNFAVAGMVTSAGSIALAGLRPRADAHQVKRLRGAGAVILAHANMDEFAETTTGVSSLGGQTRNPYDLVRSPGGSSGGSAVAATASFAAVAFGTDTCGSMRMPAANNNLFALRPTKGLSSMGGIIPCSHTHDTAGPLARTVADLAISLDATVGPDPDDPATGILQAKPLPDFVGMLDRSALHGARIGVLADLFPKPPEVEADVAEVWAAALQAMTDQGAAIQEVALPAVWGLDELMASAVWRYEFRDDLARYLADVPGAPVRSVADILAGKLHGAPVEGRLIRYQAVAQDDDDAYRAALERQAAARRALLGLLDEHRLDAVVYPTLKGKTEPIGGSRPQSTAAISAMTGFPAVAIPAGLTSDGVPVGIELLGRPLSDARLVSLAYSYEQAAQPRRAPASVPGLRGRQA